MQRITFGGPDVARFVPAGPDRHVKLFGPRRPGGPIDIPAMPDDGDVRRRYGAHLLHRGEVAAGAPRCSSTPCAPPTSSTGRCSRGSRARRRTCGSCAGTSSGSAGSRAGPCSFTGYWRLHRTQDDAPSEEEIAEQAEVPADAAWD
ncbi:hypothetical protein BJF90_27575 [Pseudonocardia sp. CNS-004]|nr:hypothetical protein BJF90_27575 [Pseudonocardia sp. CNS-004]